MVSTNEIDLEHYQRGLEFLYLHPFEEVNRRPVLDDSGLLEPETVFPMTIAYDYLALKPNRDSEILATKRICDNDDPVVLSELIIRMVGAYVTRLETSQPHLYPRLKDGQPTPFFVKEEGPCKIALEIIGENYPELVVRRIN